MVDQALPRQLGNYRLLEELRRGGEARVYKGMDSAGKIVAIKVLHIRGTTADIQRRFEREVQNLQRLGVIHTSSLSWILVSKEHQPIWSCPTFPKGP